MVDTLALGASALTGVKVQVLSSAPEELHEKAANASIYFQFIVRLYIIWVIMKLSTQPYKGARDFYPEDKRLQKYLFQIMRVVAEKYGYEEYDAPILEPTDLYKIKGNQEIIDSQTYTFTDRGDRSITLRTEMTPTVSRMVAARRQDLAYPLRWYSIPNLWRYERPQRGRLREFWQLNIDLFGIDGLEADHEIISIADALLQAYGAKRDMYSIRINSRALVDYILNELLGLTPTEATTIIHLVDRMHKMEPAAFEAQLDTILSPSEREGTVHETLLSILRAGSVDELPEKVKQHESMQKLNKLGAMLESGSITNFTIDMSLMRGFEYYSDIVFEVFDTHPDNNRAMFGGGRYDGLVGAFGVEPVPTVGFGMGDVTLQNFLEIHNLLPKLHTETEVYAISVGEVETELFKVVEELREMGLKVASDFTKRSADKKIKAAVKKGIPYVLFVGEQEVSDELYTLKTLSTGTSEQLSLQRIVSSIKDFRK